ncbi:MAG: adenosine kinase [Verrucomicrobia bacterium]|nr:adenosine kinase [Verrucomicrobiota bacterium]
MKKKIIGVGSPVVDTIALVDDAFLDNVNGDKGGMLLVESTELGSMLNNLPAGSIRAPGGSAGNTLFALARMGAPAALLGKLGNCSIAEFYLEQFKHHGGETSRFKHGSIPNGHCLSLVTPDGERTMRTDLGAAMTLSPEEINVPDFEGYEFAHLEGYLLFNEALMRKVLESAKTAGCTISLDLASFEVVQATSAVLPDILESYVDIVFANEEEASAFTGIQDDYPAMARALHQHCDVAAVKIGARGSFVAQNGEVHTIDPVQAKQVIDTTTAGDLWAAGFLYGWLEGRPATECAHLGSQLGAAVVQQQGSVLQHDVWTELLQAINA